MLTVDQVTEFLRERLLDPQLEGCFLVDIELKGSKKLCVFIDSEKGVSFSECKRISRFLEERIEENNLMDPNYLLEVSSPGVGRPLKFARQYPKHVGRKIEVALDEITTTGKLIEVNDDFIVLEVKNDSKKAESRIEKVNFDSIISAKVLISFN